jgi:hypothetical protein
MTMEGFAKALAVTEEHQPRSPPEPTMPEFDTASYTTLTDMTLTLSGNSGLWLSGCANRQEPSHVDRFRSGSVSARRRP